MDRIKTSQRASHEAQLWLSEAAPILSLAALGVLTFLYALLAIDFLGLQAPARNLALYAASLLVLPLVSAAAQNYLVRPVYSDRLAGTRESFNTWWAVLALVSAAAIAIPLWRSDRQSVPWHYGASYMVGGVLLIHLAGLAAINTLERYRPALLDQKSEALRLMRLRSLQMVALCYSFFFAFIALFRLEPAKTYLNWLLLPFTPSGTAAFPSQSQISASVFVAALVLLIAVGLLQIERALQQRDPAACRRAQRAAMAAALGLLIALFFDFSLVADPLHFLTNIGPALHMRHGGTLMVDTFSQYGIAPVLLSYFAFELGPTTFGSASLAIQICNLAFYALFLFALFLLAPRKLPALWLGLLAVAAWLSGWVYGNGNVNYAPSVIGGRYLPAILMVVAISLLAPGRRHSALTFLSMLLATLWSAEILIAALLVHFGFLFFAALCDRAYPRLVYDIALAVVPVGLGILAVSLATILASGRLPSIGIYLSYLLVYNPLGPYWSVPFKGAFWGWIPLLMVAFVCITLCWLAVFRNDRDLPIGDSTALLQKWLPATLLLAFMSLYFVGRSVDFVILIALLPFCLLIIPAIVWLAEATTSRHWIFLTLAPIPLIVVLWTSSYSLLHLFRPNSPYSFYFHECGYHGRCTPSALARSLSDAMHHRVVLEPPRHRWSTPDKNDRTIVTDAVRMIEDFGTDQSKVTVLLGAGAGSYQILSELALMHTGKWHVWPRSYTLSDGLLPSLVELILAAPIRLESGALVIVRRDETKLDPIERGILQIIRSSGTLCALDDSSQQVSAYRFSERQSC